MGLYDTINIVGITAYTLLAVFFLWVKGLSSTFSRTHYWLIAVLMMLSARLNLLFLPALLSQEVTQTIYAILLTIEKVFVTLGLLYFIAKKLPPKALRHHLAFSIMAIIGITVSPYLFSEKTIPMVWFSSTQAIYLAMLAAILWQNRHFRYTKNKFILIIVLFIYALHWITFPIAVNYPTWLSFGYFFGNCLNLFVYLSFAYMVIHRFQFRLERAERAALSQADKTEKASEAKSEFLANMSHEIRTPMNGVLSMLELLNEDKLTEEQHSRVNIALKSGKNLLTIINDILDFSKIEAGKLTFEKIEFNLTHMLKEVTGVIENLSHNKGLELILDTSGISHKIVSSDPVRVKQIILNIAGNAIKFTESGRVLIKATTQEVDGKLQFTCSISDTGLGIEKQQLDQIFSSFSQADSTTTRNYGGTGLGLSISKRLSNLLHGDIHVESEMNVGSTFTIVLPFDIAPSQKESTYSPSIANLHILVVDDKAINANGLKNLLEQWKIKVTTAETNADALTLCENENSFNIVILSQQVSEVNGDNLGQKIKSLPTCKRIKLILSSSDEELINSAPNLPPHFDYCLNKSVEPATLRDALQDMIDKTYNANQESDNSSNFIPLWSPDTKILLVEDNRINQVVAKKLLMEFNLACEIANNGAEAIAKLKVSNEINKPYTVILMDCQMPVIDGYEATKLIRSGDCGDVYLKVPIIAMTANAMTGDREKCLSVGMNDYFTKPLEKNVMLNVLKNWIVY